MRDLFRGTLTQLIWQGEGMRAKMILFYEFWVILVARRLEICCNAAWKKHKDPSNKSELADAFLLRSDERNPPCCQATHLKWMLLQEGKKKRAWLSDWGWNSTVQVASLYNLGSGSWRGHPSRCVLNGAICFETTVQSETGSYVWTSYMFLLSELWPGWDAIRTFFCLQSLCTLIFKVIFPVWGLSSDVTKALL